MNLNITKFVTSKKGLACAAAAVALLWNLPLIAADAVHYQSQAGASKIKIEGDSTIHKWTMEGPVIGGMMEIEGAVIDTTQEKIAGVNDGSAVNAKVQAFIPVRSVKSGHDIMDGLYQEALKEPTNPKIIYTLTEMKLKAGHVAGKPFEFDTTGQLAIAGVTNAVSIPVKIENVDKTKIKITGNAPLKMTAFGIKPPAPNIGLGLMKCTDDVNIVFEWTLTEKPMAK